MRVIHIFHFIQIMVCIAAIAACGKKSSSVDPCSDENYDAEECGTAGYQTRMPDQGEPKVIDATPANGENEVQPLPVDPVKPTQYIGCTRGAVFFDGNAQGLWTLAVFFDGDTTFKNYTNVAITYKREGIEPKSMIVTQSSRVAFIEGLVADVENNYEVTCNLQTANADATVEGGAKILLPLPQRPTNATTQYFGCTFGERGVFPGHEKEGSMIHFYYPKSASEIIVKRDGVKIYSSFSDSKILDEAIDPSTKHKYTCSAMINGHEVDGIYNVEI